MKEIVIISGKGGTGKTSLAACLVALAEKAVVADCDVDAADLHLILNPVVKETQDFSGGKMAKIIPDKCSGCGRCFELCRFEAVVLDEGKSPGYEIDPISCEGCGVCSHFCPEEAIEFNPSINGQWFISDTRYGPMVHARLGIAEENSGKLVTLVRNRAKEIAEDENAPYIFIDGPPGIGCPVIASVTDSDAVLIITEPTMSGEHDLERVVQLINHFKIPAYLCINKFDINTEMSKSIEEKAMANGVTVVGRIHYDRAVTEAQVKRIPVVELADTIAAKDIRDTWNNLNKEISLLE